MSELLTADEIQSFNYGTPESPNWDIELLLDLCLQKHESLMAQKVQNSNKKLLEEIEKILEN